jgi:trans-aconitate methyltransferase
MDRAAHWNQVFATKATDQVSWFETVPAVSLRLLDAAGLTRDSRVIDIGGGDSHLIDQLLERGVRHVAVLDVSLAALDRARRRLGEMAAVPTWIEADVTGTWTLAPVDFWHDRAAFHFLTLPEEREAYLMRLLQTLKPGGTAIIATFAADGPERCSGMQVVRYSPESLARELGPRFELVDTARHAHTTPWGSAQSFQYSVFRLL